MKSIHIRNLNDDTLARLKNRAARHRRSLQKEVESLLEDAARMTPADEPTQLKHKLVLKTVSTGKPTAQWDRESIYGNDGR
ncbi:MAG: FitA-like ribbon-helix-helix domain-containing protein [Opitutaceae bacterium]